MVGVGDILDILGFDVLIKQIWGEERHPKRAKENSSQIIILKICHVNLEKNCPTFKAVHNYSNMYYTVNNEL